MPEIKNAEIKAIARDIRISPRKVAVVADLVRRRSVADALVILEHTERKAAGPIIKVINSAVANAKHNNRLSVEQLQALEIETIMVTEGSSFKRYKFVGAGRRARPRPMVKKSSHVTVVLVSPEVREVKKEVKENKAPAKPASKKAETKTPVKKTEVKKAAPKKEAKK